MSERIPQKQIEDIYTDNTLIGTGKPGTPLGVDPSALPDADNKLDDSFAHFKEQLLAPSNPPSGETKHYTFSYLQGAVKVTEHRIRNSKGEDTIVKSTVEVL